MIHLEQSRTKIKIVPATVRLKTPRSFIMRTNGRVFKMTRLEIFKVRESDSSEWLCSLFTLDGRRKNGFAYIALISSCFGSLGG